MNFVLSAIDRLCSGRGWVFRKDHGVKSLSEVPPEAEIAPTESEPLKIINDQQTRNLKLYNLQTGTGEQRVIDDKRDVPEQLRNNLDNYLCPSEGTQQTNSDDSIRSWPRDHGYLK